MKLKEIIEELGAEVVHAKGLLDREMKKSKRLKTMTFIATTERIIEALTHVADDLTEGQIDLVVDWMNDHDLRYTDIPMRFVRDFTSETAVRDEMDEDMRDGGMPVGEIEGCLNHWFNEYQITRR
ncbi:MAG: hypothetical protein RBT65_18615 [Methanolobus sp.]|nr:hypothetical protein [Methanolobus sp.]